LDLGTNYCDFSILTLEGKSRVFGRGLQHPHVVPFLGTEVSDDGSSILIFMEYARDGNLAEYARRDGGLGEVEAGWCLEQVVYGLSYLHNNRIIHRDIKGANCLVYFLGEGGDRGGSSGNFSKHLRPRIKLADFGSAKALASMVTATGENRTLQGTVNWMPPEVCRVPQNTQPTKRNKETGLMT
jgi:serine/threonine protein kinase